MSRTEVNERREHTNAFTHKEAIPRPCVASLKTHSNAEIEQAHAYRKNRSVVYSACLNSTLTVHQPWHPIPLHERQWLQLLHLCSRSATNQPSLLKIQRCLASFAKKIGACTPHRPPIDRAVKQKGKGEMATTQGEKQDHISVR
jgi:hypothetical protein